MTDEFSLVWSTLLQYQLLKRQFNVCNAGYMCCDAEGSLVLWSHATDRSANSIGPRECVVILHAFTVGVRLGHSSLSKAWLLKSHLIAENILPHQACIAYMCTKHTFMKLSKPASISHKAVITT